MSKVMFTVHVIATYPDRHVCKEVAIVVPIPSKLRLETRFKIRPNDVIFGGLLNKYNADMSNHKIFYTFSRYMVITCTFWAKCKKISNF